MINEVVKDSIIRGDFDLITSIICKTLDGNTIPLLTATDYHPSLTFRINAIEPMLIFERDILEEPAAVILNLFNAMTARGRNGASTCHRTCLWAFQFDQSP